MNRTEAVQAKQFVRRLRGGSQPVLIEASDGLLYVVKFHNNFQGPNLLFNEVVGTELFKMAGLPVPAWRPISISERFLQTTPECWMEAERGLIKPQAGICFGSRFLEQQENRVFEILAGGYFSRVKARENFWTAWVLDVLAENTDNRQALFLEEGTRKLSAWFIDHGHLLGGARGTEVPWYRASRYIDPRVYTEAGAQDAEAVEATIRRISLQKLADRVMQLPEQWKTTSSLLRFGRLIERLGNQKTVSSIAQFVLGMTESLREEARSRESELKTGYLRFRSEGTGVRAPLPAPSGHRIAAGTDSFVCTTKRRGPLSVHPSWPEAVGF